MKKVCVVAYETKQQADESNEAFMTRCIALEYIRYGKVVLVPDDFDYQETLMRLAEEFQKDEPDFRAVEFELQVVDA